MKGVDFLKKSTSLQDLFLKCTSLQDLISKSTSKLQKDYLQV